MPAVTSMPGSMSLVANCPGGAVGFAERELRRRLAGAKQDSCVVSWPAFDEAQRLTRGRNSPAEASKFPANCLQTHSIPPLSYGDKFTCSERMAKLGTGSLDHLICRSKMDCGTLRGRRRDRYLR